MTELFSQKKRNRPILITDIAISKIPKAHIPGFREEEDLFIQRMHQKLLAMSKEMNASKEVGIMIDIISWQIWSILGDANEVETKNNPDAYIALKSFRKNTLIFMHNHPSTGTFSGVDFKTFCDNDTLYAITVVGNDGSVFTLTKTAEFNKGKAFAYYHDLAMNTYKNYVNNGTMAMKELLHHCDEIGLIYGKGGR